MELKVNHGALDGASGDLASGAANIQSALDTMDAELQQLKALVLRMASELGVDPAA